MENAEEENTTPNKPEEEGPEPPPSQEHRSLKYSLLGPSLLKAGQDAVDQRKVSRLS